MAWGGAQGSTRRRMLPCSAPFLGSSPATTARQRIHRSLTSLKWGQSEV
jgi:hypothetical protein